jgi:hypothetical protein
VEWTPLEDAYEEFLGQLERAGTEGLLSTPRLAREHGWPPGLHLADSELEELARFTESRAEEIAEAIRVARGTGDAYERVMRVVLNGTVAAMMWERERVG